MKMKHLISASGAAILAAALAAPAAAVVTVEPGVYVFMAADGSSQTYTVTIDGGGNTAVTGLGVGFIEPCTVTGTETPYTLETTWGTSGDYVIAPNGTVKIAATYNYFVFDITLHFGSNGIPSNTLSTITTYGLTLYPVDSDKPKKSLFCESPLQTAAQQSFTPPAGAVEPAASKGTKFSVEAGN